MQPQLCNQGGRAVSDGESAKRAAAGSPPCVLARHRQCDCAQNRPACMHSPHWLGMINEFLELLDQWATLAQAGRVYLFMEGLIPVSASSGHAQ